VELLQGVIQCTGAPIIFLIAEFFGKEQQSGKRILLICAQSMPNALRCRGQLRICKEELSSAPRDFLQAALICQVVASAAVTERF